MNIMTTQFEGVDQDLSFQKLREISYFLLVVAVICPKEMKYTDDEVYYIMRNFKICFFFFCLILLSFSGEVHPNVWNM
jgi:protein-S-isoprenylcysteine O-methyltransferase Ste14